VFGSDKWYATSSWIMRIIFIRDILNCYTSTTGYVEEEGRRYAHLLLIQDF
jgi:hypothetical protein